MEGFQERWEVHITSGDPGLKPVQDHFPCSPLAKSSCEASSDSGGEEKERLLFFTEEAAKMWILEGLRFGTIFYNEPLTGRPG